MYSLHSLVHKWIVSSMAGSCQEFPSKELLYYAEAGSDDSWDNMSGCKFTCNAHLKCKCGHYNVLVLPSPAISYQPLHIAYCRRQIPPSGDLIASP